MNDPKGDEQASDEQASDEQASDEQASDEQASDERASDERASDEQASDERASPPAGAPPEVGSEPRASAGAGAGAGVEGAGAAGGTDAPEGALSRRELRAVEPHYDRLQQLTWGFAPLPVLRSAAETGLLAWLAEREPDREASGPEAADALDLHPGATTKVLRALAGMDLLEGDGERFRMREGARPLFRPGSDLDHTAALSHIFGLSRAWAEHLTGWLQSGDWPRPERSDRDVADFVRAMRALAHGMAGRLSDVLDLSDARDLVDVGGALGTFSLELCRVHPELRATVLDRPDVVELTQDEIARYGLTDRVGTQAGDYLQSPLPEADVVLLANVTHQESRADAAAMVRRAAEALRPGGQVVVLDFTLERDRSHPLTGALFAINMRLFGDTYAEADFRVWLADAGLEEITRHDLSDLKLVITARKPR
jgi:hypothetical protein